jgi:omega-hydroxypalmitate O-feruloyl transferase
MYLDSKFVMQETLIMSPRNYVQVTRFRCGGFTGGFRMSHSMCDGMSSAQFFRSFCKLARGEALTTFPDLDRTILKPRDPPAPEFDHPEYFKSADVIPSTIPNGAGNGHDLNIVTPEYITKHIPMSLMEIQTLKTIAMADGSIKRCSSFEVTIAHFWQARTRSLQFAPSELTNLLIAVDFRAKMQPPISPTFCGNTIISAHVSALASEVARNPLSYCVAKIQEAVARVDERYVRSALDWLQLHGGVPAIGSAKDVLVSAWWKLPFYEHDFGWGKPVHSGPPSGSTPHYALVVSNGTDDGGLLLLVSYRPHEMVKFERHLKDI